MTHLVSGARVLDDTAAAVLCKQWRANADFCGVEGPPDSIRSNLFRVLLKVPQRIVPPASELLRRDRLLHQRPTKYQAGRIEVIAAVLARGAPEVRGAAPAAAGAQAFAIGADYRPG